MRTGRSIGVLDDLYCRVLVLRVKKKTFLWITLDLCLVENVMTEYVREVFAAKYSILKEKYSDFDNSHACRTRYQFSGRGARKKPCKGGIPGVAGKPYDKSGRPLFSSGIR